MSTTKSLRKLAARFVLIQQSSRDIDENFPTVVPIVLGVLHVFFALFSVALGIGSICTHASGYFIGYGIWCGFFFLVVGIVTLINACIKDSAMITTNLVFNILGWCVAAVQFSLGIVAAANDSSGSDRFSNSLPTYRYDIYYTEIHNHYCAGGSGFDYQWRQWGAVDVLLILVGALESFIAIVCIVFCIRSICCSTVTTDEVTQPQLIQNGYNNGGYGMAPSELFFE